MRYFRKGGISNGSTPFLRTVEAASYRTEHDTETETPELPIVNEATTEAGQPEHEEQTAPVIIDKDEERSAPLGIIITAVTLLSASGAIWFIKRNR